MFLLEILSLAYDSITGNKLRAGLTILGMIIGVSAVVLLVSIGNGAKKYINSEFEGLGSNIILVQPGKTDSKGTLGPPISSSKGKLTLSDVDALLKYGFNLSHVSGIMFATGTVKYGEHTNNIHLLGTNEQFDEIFNIRIEWGNYITKEEDETGRRVVVLGHQIVKNLFGAENPLGKLVKVSDSEHRVIGTIKHTGDKLGFNVDEIAFIPNKSAMRLFNSNKLFGIRAQARTRGLMNEAVKEITSILKERHNGEEDFTIITQTTMIQTMDTIMGMLTYVLFGIAMISMIVGGIGIMNIMLVSVTERTREIGIRRAVGAKRSHILHQFLAEAIALSLAGGLIGILISLIITYGIYGFFPKFDMRPPLWILAPSFLLSLFTGIIFGVWPARKASRIETIDALRYE